MTLVALRDPYGDASDAAVWVKGQLHCHTSRSFDGRLPVEEVAASYLRQGFDFVCITDHDRLWDRYEWHDGLLLLPGEESTLARPFPPLGRHLVRLLTTEPVPRLAPAADKMERTVRTGGLLAAAHPAWSGNLGTGRWSVEALCDPRLSLVEIVNHHAPTSANLALWDQALSVRGPDSPLWATAVDDSHRPEQIGRGWVWVRVGQPLRRFASPEQAARALRASLARGAFYASTGARVRFSATVDGRRPVVRVLVDRDGGDGPAVVRFVGTGGRVLAETRGWEALYPVQGDEGYVRVEVEQHDQSCAWSQPFWVVTSGAPRS